MTEREHFQEPFTTLSSRIAWSCPWYSVRKDQILLPDGEEGEYNVVQHDGAVWIIPVTCDGQLILLRHYRYTVRDWCWELPAGGIKDGHAPIEVAREELSQETGGESQTWTYIGQFYTSNGISNEVAHIFLAEGVVTHQTDHEPAEVMEVHRFPVAEALRMARANEISDGPSALALLLCEARLQNLIDTYTTYGED
jgi:8-oxo-dGTP pyrophosphatase MutT (NUDIX family)